MAYVIGDNCVMQLIPATVAALRAGAGSARPFDILPAVWLSSAVSVAVGIGASKLFAGLQHGWDARPGVGADIRCLGFGRVPDAKVVHIREFHTQEFCCSRRAQRHAVTHVSRRLRGGHQQVPVERDQRPSRQAH